MRFEIAVPSYQRAERCRDSTLAMLAGYEIDPARIIVFVANDAERDEYRATLVPGTYGQIVVGVVGMRAIRNFIQQHYAQGTPVLNIDDDIYGLYQKVSDKKYQPLADLQLFATEAFEVTAKAGATLWGIYPVLNALFMKHSVTTDLRYVIGCFWGCYVQQGRAYTVTLDDKEDYERTLRHYLQDGVVARFNYVAPKTRYYEEPGGMQVERTRLRVMRSAVHLVQRYPKLCTLNTSKKSKWAEVRLRDKRAKP